MAFSLVIRLFCKSGHALIFLNYFVISLHNSRLYCIYVSYVVLTFRLSMPKILFIPKLRFLCSCIEILFILHHLHRLYFFLVWNCKILFRLKYRVDFKCLKKSLSTFNSINAQTLDNFRRGLHCFLLPDLTDYQLYKTSSMLELGETGGLTSLW
jgi:hypothetical protein